MLSSEVPHILHIREIEELSPIIKHIRTYITLLIQGKRKFGKKLADKLNAVSMASNPLGGSKSVF